MFERQKVHPSCLYISLSKVHSRYHWLDDLDILDQPIVKAMTRLIILVTTSVLFGHLGREDQPAPNSSLRSGLVVVWWKLYNISFLKEKTYITEMLVNVAHRPCITILQNYNSCILSLDQPSRNVWLCRQQSHNGMDYIDQTMYVDCPPNVSITVWDTKRYFTQQIMHNYAVYIIYVQYVSMCIHTHIHI